MSVQDAMAALEEFVEQNEVQPETHLIVAVLKAMNETVTEVADQTLGEQARMDALEDEVATSHKRRK